MCQKRPMHLTCVSHASAAFMVHMYVLLRARVSDESQDTTNTSLFECIDFFLTYVSHAPAAARIVHMYVLLRARVSDESQNITNPFLFKYIGLF